MAYKSKYLILIFILCNITAIAQSGCTDFHATNYDPSAIYNDGSCIYPVTALPLTFNCYINSTELSESSGIVNQDNNFWTHVDDSNNSIYRIDTLSDSIFQKLTLNNSTNYDWEDISSDSDYIYVGDVGNNYGDRTNLCFYKILKSDITPTSTTVNAGRINFSYSDQVNFTPNHNNNFYDCEAFFILRDSIHMFTKGWVNKWTKHYVLPADTGVQVAQLVDSFNVSGLITSAAIQGDSLVVLLGLNFYGGFNCAVWMLNDFQGSNFFSGNKRRLTLGNVNIAGQAEGICFRDTSKGYITNEQYSTLAQVREFDLNPFLGPPPPPPPVLSSSVTSISENLRACSDSGSATFIIKNTTANGGGELYFTIGSLPSWIIAASLTDSLAPGDSTMITLNFTSGTMSAGIYSANIPIQSNDPLHPVQNIYFELEVDSNLCMNFTFNSDTCTGFVNFNATSINTPTYYHWDFGDGDTSSQASPSHPYAINGNYVAKLIACNNIGCDTVIQNVYANVNGPRATSCYPNTQSYCCGMGITHFQISSSTGDVINNNSNDGNVGYENFTCTNSDTLFTNNIYALTCTTALTIAEYLKVWLDMNNDGVLDSAIEELYSDLDTIAPLHSGTITIPSLPGNVYGVPLRMRVASDFQQVPEPCLNPVYGQHEDYSVVLNFSVNVSDLSAQTDLNIHPNPFSNSTNIDFKLMQSSMVGLEVYNLFGERIELFSDMQMQPGRYHFTFGDKPPGIYFVKLEVNEVIFTKRIVKMF